MLIKLCSIQSCKNKKILPHGEPKLQMYMVSQKRPLWICIRMCMVSQN